MTLREGHHTGSSHSGWFSPATNSACRASSAADAIGGRGSRKGRSGPRDAAGVATSIDTVPAAVAARPRPRSEEHTSELQSLMRISYAVFCLKKKKNKEKMHMYYKSIQTQTQA